MVGAAWAAIGVAFLALLGLLAESRASRRSLDAKIDKLGSDLRGDIGRLDAKIDNLGADLRSDIGKLGSDLRGDIGRLDAKIDAQGAALGARLDAQTARIDHLSERVEEHLRAHA